LEALSAWIKHIILLILFATFLELLIPNNDYKKFIKVIMGLLLLLAVLQPVLDIVDRSWDNTAATTVTGSKIGETKTEIANHSAKFQNERDRVALEQYKKELTKQVRVLAGSIAGIMDVRAEIVLNENKGEKNYSTIKKITIYAKPGRESKNTAAVNSVKQVEISMKTKSMTPAAVLDDQHKEHIKKVVTEFYHLNPEQIEVIEWPGQSK
jgi:stage III sporulation protein AF